MRRHLLAARLLLVIPLAAGCGRAGASTTGAAARASAAPGVAGNCPPDARPMRPAAAATTADLNGDGYVCTRRVRSIAGDTLRATVDNDTEDDGSAPVETNLYRRM